MSAPGGPSSDAPVAGGTPPHAPLRECVREALDHYFAHLDGHETSGLFELVMAEVEAPLLEVVLRHSDGNLTRAASILGINRATLRKKLRRYDLG